MTIHLVDNGFNVFHTTSPVEGLALFQSKSLHRIFLDLEIPEMNGVEITKGKSFFFDKRVNELLKKMYK
jgi:DNA-binding response OmpR family regulator